jgi:hypothetical protein
MIFLSLAIKKQHYQFYNSTISFPSSTFTLHNVGVEKRCKLLLYEKEGGISTPRD